MEISQRKKRVFDGIRCFAQAKTFFKRNFLVGLPKTNKSEVWDMLVSEDNMFLVTIGVKKILNVWDLFENSLYWKVSGHVSRPISMVMTRDSKFLISGGNDSLIFIWNLPGKLQEHKLTGHIGCVHTIALVHDESLLISIDSEKELRIWDMATYSSLAKFQGFSSNPTDIIRTPDNKFAVVPGFLNTLKILDLEKKMIASELKCNESQIKAVALFDNTKVLVAEDKVISIFDLNDGVYLGKLLGHYGKIFYIKTTLNSEFAVSASIDYSIRVWDLKTFQEAKVFSSTYLDRNKLCLSPDSKYIYSVSPYYQLIKINVFQLTSERLTFETTNRIHSFKLMNYDTALVFSNHYTIYTYDISSMKEKSIIAGKASEIILLAVSPDYSYKVCLENTKKITIFDIEQKSIKAVLNPPYNEIQVMVFACNNKFLIFGGNGTKISVWNIEENKIEIVFPGYNEQIQMLFVTFDSKFVVSVSANQYLRVLSIEKKCMVSVIGYHMNLIQNVGFFYEGDRVKKGKREEKVLYWENIMQKR